MDLKQLIREVLDDVEATRYSDELINELIQEALLYISMKLLTFTKTVQLSATKEGKIYLPNNLGIVRVNNSCNVELKHIALLDCVDCNKTEENIDYLKYLVYGNDDKDILTLCPKIKSLQVLNTLQDVINSTIDITEADANIKIDPQYLIITYKTVPTIDEIPNSWKKLIYYYVTGNLLRFDKSTQNAQFGEAQLKHLEFDINLLRALNNNM